MIVDLDALLAPVEMARSLSEARAAVWQILRVLKGQPWACRTQELRDTIASLDAAAWQAGLSEAFRAQAIGSAYASMAQDIDGYPVIADDCMAAFYVR